jgi:hypothetical protein
MKLSVVSNDEKYIQNFRLKSQREETTMEVKVKVKVKLSLCLTKHHAMKTYCGVEV